MPSRVQVIEPPHLHSRPRLTLTMDHRMDPLMTSRLGAITPSFTVALPDSQGTYTAEGRPRLRMKGGLQSPVRGDIFVTLPTALGAPWADARRHLSLSSLPSRLPASSHQRPLMQSGRHRVTPIASRHHPAPRAPAHLAGQINTTNTEAVVLWGRRKLNRETEAKRTKRRDKTCAVYMVQDPLG